MLTVIESPLFSKLWPDYWTEEERGAFAAFIAANPTAGDVVRGSGGCRKVRWARSGTGKSGGVRVIYTARLTSGAVVLAADLRQERTRHDSCRCAAGDCSGDGTCE